MGLDWIKRGTGSGVIELTEHGATVSLFISKTSEGEALEQVYPKSGRAIEELKRWVNIGRISEGTPVFRSVTKRGQVNDARLTDGSVARIIKSRGKGAGLDPGSFAGHSLRAGMVTSAAENDVPEWRIRMTSRHRSIVLNQYIRPVEKRKHALTNDIGL